MPFILITNFSKIPFREDKTKIPENRPPKSGNVIQENSLFLMFSQFEDKYSNFFQKYGPKDKIISFLNHFCG